MADIVFDDSELQRRATQLLLQVEENAKRIVSRIADEILRLSSREVPLDKGTLKDSGNVQPKEPELEQIVGYNTPYAARLHEHPEYHFQNGRKGKYLEDPIKNNLGVFKLFWSKTINS